MWLIYLGDGFDITVIFDRANKRIILKYIASLNYPDNKNYSEFHRMSDMSEMWKMGLYLYFHFH